MASRPPNTTIEWNMTPGTDTELENLIYKSLKNSLQRKHSDGQLDYPAPRLLAIKAGHYRLISKEFIGLD